MPFYQIDDLSTNMSLIGLNSHIIKQYGFYKDWVEVRLSRKSRLNIKKNKFNGARKNPSSKTDNAMKSRFKIK